jgi:tellurite resistance protein TerC
MLTRLPDGRRAVTLLLVTLVVVENTDVLFAVDSIPAVFAVTTDPFLVFTSNIFAILGLRSLYFALNAMLNRFHLLKFSIVSILAFIGTKMLLAKWIQISSGISLLVIVVALTLGIIASLVFPFKPTSK